MTTTDRSTVAGTATRPADWVQLRTGPGERHQLRGELLPGRLPGAPGTPLLTLAHLSDLHVCDSQSPARVPFLDRWADADAATKPALLADGGLGLIGTYRAQELLTAQVVEAAVRAVNAVAAGPVGHGAVDLALVTGDVTDNAQANELDWYLRLLEGGPVTPDSGSPDRYEGTADDVAWHEAYWHPEPGGARVDRPHRLHGFPDAPGLLDAARRSFPATGLTVPWLAVHGNHDRLLQGTVPAVGALAAAGSAASGPVDVPADWTPAEVLRLLAGLERCEPDALAQLAVLPRRPVTPDPARRPITKREFVGAHFGPRARPAGHGFVSGGLVSGGLVSGDFAHYRFDTGRVTVLTLDTVNPHGGWQGSIDLAQLCWLTTELDAADREQRYVVLASHHPLRTLTNNATPDGADLRADGEEVADALAGHPSLVLWLNGHTHVPTVTPHDGGHPWWEVTTPSLIDHPQQGRIVELLRSDDGVLTIATTMVDHDGELPWSGRVDDVPALAGLSRALAANDWQVRTTDLAAHPAAGSARDRNALLLLPDPFPSSPAGSGSAQAAIRRVRAMDSTIGASDSAINA